MHVCMYVFAVLQISERESYEEYHVFLEIQNKNRMKI